jgi:Dihaem cytochrome c
MRSNPVPRAAVKRDRPMVRGALLAVTMAASLAGSARADSVGTPANAPPAYRTECGACHLAYPPGLLPASSWQRLMVDLPRHFGSDASLDAAMTAELSTWLQANAASFKKVRRNPEAPPEDRITRSAWFVREHREVATGVWRRTSIGSAANCGACHSNAAQGRFSEHELRIPR